MTLVILAAGIGSRFGGLKQMTPFGPCGEFIIDYSVYDAIKVGFKKVVFVIKEENYEDFRNTIGKRVSKYIDVSYVFQKVDDIPFDLDFKREKPWGTAQAILACKDVIKENFCVINADDFYGIDSFKCAYNFLSNLNEENHFGLIGFEVLNTLTENGSVKRGVLNINDNKLLSITESKIELIDDKIHCISLEDKNEFDITSNTLVSMNMILFTPKIFDYLESDFKEFLKTIKDNLNEEFLIPIMIDKHIKNNDINVSVIKTKSRWYGVTYKEDVISVINAINELIDNNEYKYNLWE